MNPGKVVDARPLDADLRYGTDYHPIDTQTWFRFPEDAGSFARATRRCVGVGKCRKTDTGAMCPSYMVTREEQHSTRGRAHLLFEMMRSETAVLEPASEHVHEALDLCLACKACKGECPVHVDMATYKAEFLSRYYETRWRPRSAWAFGHVHTWARVAALAPRAVNLVTRTPGARQLAALMAGVAGERRIPQFAPATFREWFRDRPARPRGHGSRVILWPDTFNDHFHPGTLRAAVEVLEGAGVTVDIPRNPLCCGRPLYDFGLLSTARRRLDTIMTSLADEIAAGTLVVGLEPSCLSVFRDELVNLFPDDERARRLRAQTCTLAEYLGGRGDALPPLRLTRRALVHGHCHQQALAGLSPDRAMLDQAGVRHELLDSGCCGMAGAFGFERGHYEVSMAVGERVLLPAVRAATRDTLIVADGFSCREQIAQATDRRALHLAEVLHMAMFRGPDGPAGDLPEREYVREHPALPLRPVLAGAAVAAGALLLARAVWRRVGK